MPKYIAALAAAVLVVACGGGDSSGPKQATVASVTLSQPSQTLFVGTTLVVTATPKDGSGNSLTGRPATWTSSNSSIASVTNGSITALSPGSATITATVEGKTATIEITVQLAPVASVSVTPVATSVLVGGTTQLTATVKDANGNVLTGRTVTWSSSDESKVRVSATGVVTGVALGSATITATSEGKSGTSTVYVTDGTPPIVASVSPDTLTAGISATINGTGFSPNPGQNSVTVAGVPVTVTAASLTQLTILLPTPMPCQATQEVSVIVTTADGVSSAQKPLKVAIQRSLTVGQALLLTNFSDITCNELSQTGGRYIVSVYSTAREPGTTAQFELKGSSVPGGSPSIRTTVSGPAARSTPSVGLASVMASEVRAKIERDAQAMKQHSQLLEQDRKMFQRNRAAFRARYARSTSILGGASASAAASSSVSSLATTPIPLTVGAMTSLRVRQIGTNTCSTYNSIRARVVYVGTKGVVLEDSVGALARTMDADLIAVGQEFDNVMYPILTTYFGDPLKVDAETDNNGKVVMLFTPQVNSQSAGLQGFVSACDFAPPTEPGYESSNYGEFFYARVPTAATGSFLNPSTLPGWRANMRGTIIHEVKHITAYAEKLSDPTAETLEENWLEEGTAQMAIEFYARTKYTGASWKSNARYATTVYCDFHPTAGGACNHGQFLMGDHFLETYRYYQANETKSYLSSGFQDITIYGSAWEFARWVTDQYAATEAGFLKALIQESHLTGLDNIENKTGHLYPELNGYFTLSLLADDYAGFSAPNGAKYTFPSWNVPDIMAGLAGEHLTLGGVAIDDPSPLNTHNVSFGSFDVTVPTLVGGSGSLFDISGVQAGKQLLELRDGSGTLAPETPLRLAILRVQ
jgi:hypothetical protein